jgi:putative ABC transport system substrate-binding protein
MASELAGRRAAAIAATGGLRSAHAVQGETLTIPALFIAAAGQVQTGIAAGAGRPGRGLTGVRADLTRMAAKRLELLKELMPAGGKVGVLVGPGSAAGDRSLLSQSERRLAESQGAVLVRIGSPPNFDRDLDDALASAVRAGVRGFIVGADPFFTSRRESIVALAAKHRLVALYPLRSYVEAGGLASYGPDLVDMYHQIGMYTGQILKGARPGDLPVVAPRKWDLVISRKTATSLHLDVAPWIIARANEVID